MPDEPTTNDNVEEVVEPSQSTEVPQEPVEPEVPEPSEEPEEGPQEESEEEAPEEKPPSRREQLRIQSLLAKYGPPPERQPSQRPEALDYQTALDADPEVIQQLEADRQREGQTQYNEGLKRAEYLNWHTSLKIDAPVVEKKYPVLDPTSSEFHPAVANAVNSWYVNMSGADPSNYSVGNPNVGYAEFVDGFMELVQETAGQRNAQTVKNVARQAATTGLRPDGSSAKRLNLNQAPENMSIEELYAKIGQAPPKKS